jgi:pyruvate,water dikinase
VLSAIRAVYASLFNDRAIAYRVHHKFPHREVAISAGIQQMVRTDLGASGVMFTVDTESGFEGAVFITSSYGLGEAVVQGAVNPDEFYVYKAAVAANRPAILKRKRGSKAIKMVYTSDGTLGKTIETVEVSEPDRQRLSLSDEQVTELARYGVIIEQHYGRPMDIEWGLDGVDSQLYILQARPETVTTRRSATAMESYRLLARAKPLITGRAIGQRIGSGVVRTLKSISEMAEFQPGDVLVADMTDPDWEPIMKRSSAIVTNRGGRTCHAAIIARELGIPAVVGTGNATDALVSGQPVTVSCAEGDTGFVYPGQLEFKIEHTQLGEGKPLPVKLMLNVGNPDQAFTFSSIANDGVGLARLEFIINREVGIHPLALLNLDQLDSATRQKVAERIAGEDPRDYFIRELVEGIATIAAAFDAKPVIVRLSDFKSNEYANLLGGKQFEPQEENPMLGYRGAARYLTEDFRPAFDMECEALRIVRNDMGFRNVQLMVPFVRTPEEGAEVVRLLAANGLVRGEADLKVIMMCELPTNALRARDYLQHFDGMSIGSNDLTQLTLGIDRDSGLVAAQFDERDAAVTQLMGLAITACRAEGKYIGICGQGPSDHPDLAEWLVSQGIDSLSLNPDSVMLVRNRLLSKSAQ